MEEEKRSKLGQPPTDGNRNTVIRLRHIAVALIPVMVLLAVSMFAGVSPNVEESDAASAFPTTPGNIAAGTYTGSTLTTAGTYKLTGDVTIDTSSAAGLVIDGGTQASPIIIDLNGYILTASSVDNNVLTINSGKYFTLTSSNTQAQHIFTYYDRGTQWSIYAGSTTGNDVIEIEEAEGNTFTSGTTLVSVHGGILTGPAKISCAGNMTISEANVVAAQYGELMGCWTVSGTLTVRNVIFAGIYGPAISEVDDTEKQRYIDAANGKIDMIGIKIIMSNNNNFMAASGTIKNLDWIGGKIQCGIKNAGTLEVYDVYIADLVMYKQIFDEDGSPTSLILRDLIAHNFIINANDNGINGGILRASKAMIDVQGVLLYDCELKKMDPDVFYKYTAAALFRGKNGKISNLTAYDVYADTVVKNSGSGNLTLQNLDVRDSIVCEGVYNSNSSGGKTVILDSTFNNVRTLLGGCLTIGPSITNKSTSYAYIENTTFTDCVSWYDQDLYAGWTYPVNPHDIDDSDETEDIGAGIGAAIYMGSGKNILHLKDVDFIGGECHDWVTGELTDNIQIFLKAKQMHSIVLEGKINIPDDTVFALRDVPKTDKLGDITWNGHIYKQNIKGIQILENFSGTLGTIYPFEDSNMDDKVIYNLAGNLSADDIIKVAKIYDSDKWRLELGTTNGQVISKLNIPSISAARLTWSEKTGTSADLSVMLSLTDQNAADEIKLTLSKTGYTKTQTFSDGYAKGSTVKLTLEGVDTTKTACTLTVNLKNGAVSDGFFTRYTQSGVSWIDPSGKPTITSWASSATYNVGDTAQALTVEAQRPASDTGTGTFKYEFLSGISADSCTTTVQAKGDSSSYAPIVTNAGSTYYVAKVYYTPSGGGSEVSVETPAILIKVVDNRIRYFDGNGSQVAGLIPSTFDPNVVTNLAAVPSSLEKAGRTAYWADVNTGARMASIPVGQLGMVQVKVAYELKTYTVSYNLDGGSNSQSNPATFTVESSVTLSDPTRSGYIFGGWYSDSNFVNKVTGWSNRSDDMTLYAKWTEMSYTVKLDPNGGAFADGSTTIRSSVLQRNASLYLPDSLTKAEYTLAGWTEVVTSGTPRTFEKGTSVSNLSTVQGDTITLQAQWTLGTYLLYFDLNGGTGTSAAMEFTSGTTTFTDASNDDPTRLGYDFGGWSRTASGTTAAFSGHSDTTIVSYTGNATLYAIWTLKTYYIGYSLDSGTNSGMNVASYNINSGTVKLYDATRSGYSFVGWYTDSEKKNKVTSLPAITSDTPTGTSEDPGQTMYAKFVNTTYTIAFDEQGGTTVSDITAKLNTAYTAPNTSKAGYVFLGWYESVSKKTYSAGATLKDLAASGTVTLTAQWAELTYSIAYDLGGGIFVSAPAYEYKTGTQVAIPEPSRTGYKFVGWLGSDLQGQTYSVVIPETAKGDKQYLAQWQASVIAIVFSEDSGTSSASFDYGSSILLPTADPVDGQDFIGWYDSSGNLVGPAGKYYTVTGSATLYARYSQGAYVLTLVSSNPAYGSVTGVTNVQAGSSGYLYAIPVDGYMVSSVETTSGTCDIYRTGELAWMTVPSSNATITVTFAVSDAGTASRLALYAEKYVQADNGNETGLRIHVESPYGDRFTASGATALVKFTVCKADSEDPTILIYTTKTTASQSVPAAFAESKASIPITLDTGETLVSMYALYTYTDTADSNKTVTIASEYVLA